LERISRGLVRHPGRGELAQLLIDEREQFISGFRVATLNGVEDASDGTDAGNTTLFSSTRPENWHLAVPQDRRNTPSMWIQSPGRAQIGTDNCPVWEQILPSPFTSSWTSEGPIGSAARTPEALSYVFAQLDVPVRQIHEVLPTVMVREREVDLNEGTPFGPLGFADQAHSSLLGSMVGL
jgi:hypothetical protein